MYNWNPVYQKVMQLKNSLPKEVRETYNWEKWVEAADEQFQNLFAPVQTVQKNTMVLFRYGRFDDLFGNGENEYEDFWNIENGFYQECRSIVIDIFADDIVLAPFKKFFNFGEMDNTLELVSEKIKQNKFFEVSEKLDGSLCIARWYNDKLVVSSSKCLDETNSWRLQRMIKLIEENEYMLGMIQFNNNDTFMFEFIDQEDAHVVKYEKDQEGLYLIGMRSVITGKEYSYAFLEAIGHMYRTRVAKTYKKSLEEILIDMKELKSDQAEGYVVSIAGHKIKFKADDYVELHKIIDMASSPNVVIKHMAEERLDDLYAKVPDAHKTNIDEIVRQIKEYVSYMDINVKYYYETALKENTKVFMTWVNENVPKQFQAHVRNIWLGKENDFIRKGKTGYKKIGEMGVNK